MNFIGMGWVKFKDKKNAFQARAKMNLMSYRGRNTLYVEIDYGGAFVEQATKKTQELAVKYVEHETKTSSTGSLLPRKLEELSRSKAPEKKPESSSFTSSSSSSMMIIDENSNHFHQEEDNSKRSLKDRSWAETANLAAQFSIDTSGSFLNALKEEKVTSGPLLKISFLSSQQSNINWSQKLMSHFSLFCPTDVRIIGTH
jgi:hypothetical protein